MERACFSKKEKEYIEQLQEIRNLHAETKKTYSATFDAMKDNERIFKSIENVQSHSKLTSAKRGDDALRRHFESEVERTRKALEEEIKSLNVELAAANNLALQQKTRLSQQ